MVRRRMLNTATGESTQHDISSVHANVGQMSPLSYLTFRHYIVSLPTTAFNEDTMLILNALVDLLTVWCK